MLTVSEIIRQKTPLAVCTAYDYPFAKALEAAGADIILVGDSLANVVLGLTGTRDVGMEEMEIFSAAARRGAPDTFITVDLPHEADSSPELAVRNSRRLMHLGASAVKLEGPKLDVIRALVAEQIPVMGHLGVLPQTAVSFKRVGVSADDRTRLLKEARDIEDAGVFAMVLENVEAGTAEEITKSLTVPTIGIGAGNGTRGQVQVLHDVLGLSSNAPPFARPFASLRDEAEKALRAYLDAARAGTLYGA